MKRMIPVGKAEAQTSGFNLTKQFALLSFLCILFMGTISTFLMSRLLTDKILARDATVSQDFVASLITAEGLWPFFLVTANNEEHVSRLNEFFTHLKHMPDVVRANVYSGGKEVLWSSDENIIGQFFNENEELDRALVGELIYEHGLVGRSEKEEHMHFDKSLLGMPFVETYIPVWNEDDSAVIGVVELYKIPEELHFSIVEGRKLIWACASLGGLLLFVSLFWIIKRASLIMESQQQRLIESRSLSMIGETASAVAHSMRNPLASIRVCAELTLTDDLEGARESALDIISETDRLDRWTRELLQFSSTSAEDTELVNMNNLIQSVLREHQTEINRRNIRVHMNMADEELYVQGHFTPIFQVLANLVMNSLEAMEEGGELIITAHRHPKNRFIEIAVCDDGPGIKKELKDRLFRPFTTSKTKGTGLGLALSRHLVEHYDGTLEIESEPGLGVTATIRLPVPKG